VIVGPHVESIAVLVAALERTGGASVVRSAAELADAVDRFLDADVGVRAGAAARDIAEQQAGSLPLTWASLEEVVRCRAERRSDS